MVRRARLTKSPKKRYYIYYRGSLESIMSDVSKDRVERDVWELVRTLRRKRENYKIVEKQNIK